MIYAFLDLYFRFATGSNWGFVFQLFAYKGGWTIHLIMAWIWLLCFVGLTVATVLRFKNPPAGSLRKNVICTAVFWLGYILIWVFLALPMYDPEVDVEMIRTFSLISSVFGAVREGFLVAAFVFTIRFIKGILAKRSLK